jgi:7-carboxy-7-deazaguanine synthase
LKAHYFKFVGDDEASLHVIERFVKDNALDPERVFIMPRGATRREQHDRMELIFSFCRDKGYRMTPRLHVLVFDDRRGV